MTAARAIITLIETLPPQEKQEVVKWVKEHENKPYDHEKVERKDFLKLSAIGLNRAYSDNEPEYTLDDCIEINPNFKP